MVQLNYKHFLGIFEERKAKQVFSELRRREYIDKSGRVCSLTKNHDDFIKVPLKTIGCEREKLSIYTILYYSCQRAIELNDKFKTFQLLVSELKKDKAKHEEIKKSCPKGKEDEVPFTATYLIRKNRITPDFADEILEKQLVEKGVSPLIKKFSLFSVIPHKRKFAEVKKAGHYGPDCLTCFSYEFCRSKRMLPLGMDHPFLEFVVIDYCNVESGYSAGCIRDRINYWRQYNPNFRYNEKTPIKFYIVNSESFYIYLEQLFDGLSKVAG